MRLNKAPPNTDSHMLPGIENVCKLIKKKLKLVIMFNINKSYKCIKLLTTY
jgi:hypothetical protein